MRTKHPDLLKHSHLFIILLVGIMLISMPAVSGSQIAPPVSGLEITEYEGEISQEAGTSADYTVTVKNIGSLDLDPVYLSPSKIPSNWFDSKGRVALEFSQTGKLNYTLTLPGTVKGVYVFTLTAVGSYGEVKETDTKPVLLTVTEAKEAAGAQITQEAAQGIMTTAGAATGGATTSAASTAGLPAAATTVTATTPIADLTEFIRGEAENPMYQLIGALLAMAMILTAARLKIKK